MEKGSYLFTVRFGSFVYGFLFRHPFGYETDSGKWVENRRATICEVYMIDPNGVDGFLYSERARCGKRDQFSKARGRQIALGRVVKNHFHASDHDLIWECYQKSVKSG